MKKRLLAMAMVISMVLSFMVIPAHAYNDHNEGAFSAANKRTNAYDICLNTDSNFVQLKGNGYEKNCL